MISNHENEELLRMFCAYCRRALKNANTDVLRTGARRARRETLFCDMHENELNRLFSPELLNTEESVFDVFGREVVVFGYELAEAVRKLPDEERTIILLYYFAGMSDRQISEELSCSRSTIQLRRSVALSKLREYLGEEACADDYL